MATLRSKAVFRRLVYHYLYLYPFDLPQELEEVLKTEEAKKVIRNFNRVSKVLIEFEMLYHRAWQRSLDDIRGGELLRTTLDSITGLLVFYSVAFDCFINFLNFL